MTDPNQPIETIFNAAKALGPNDQSAYLDMACKGDAALRQEVERLLAAASAADGFFKTEPVGVDDPESTLADTAVREGPGTVIGRYKVLQQIGEGGMGVVYMAEQTEPVVRKVALKIIKLGMDTKAVVARFEAERQALALMDHPNIAKVLDAGTTDTGRPYFVMELVRGIPITEYCDKNHLSARQRLELFIPVCQAIQHAHQKGIIHRDIKPSNVLVTLHDSQPLPMVIDFGIAKATNQRLTEKTLFTNFAQVIGTPAYMSPEQAEMTKLDVDTRTDIYSLGVLLYELLTGTTPFTAKELLEAGYAGMQRIIAEQEPPRPSTRLSTMQHSQRTTVAQNRRMEPSALTRLFQGDLDWIVMKCLEKERGRRYETASGLATDLHRHLLHEPVAARPPSAAYRLQKAIRRNRLAFLAGTVVLASMVVGLTLATLGWRQARNERNRAIAASSEAESARAAESVLRLQAQSARARETELRNRAEEQEVVARQHAYAADMHRVEQELRTHNLRYARDLLMRHAPSDGQKDLRGWEWRYLWQFCRGDAQFQLLQLTNRPGSLAWTADGRQLLVEDKRGALSFWDVESRQPTLQLQPRAQAKGGPWTGKTSRLSEGGEWLALLGWREGGWFIRVLQVMTRKTVVEIELDGDPRVNSLAVSPEGTLLAAFQAGRAVTVWEVPSGRKLWEQPVAPDLGPKAYGVVAFSPDGSLMAFGDSDGQVRVLDVPGFREKANFAASSENGVLAMAFAPDGRALAVGCAFTDPRITIWDPQSSRRLAILEGHRGFIASLAFSPNGRKLASAGGDQALKIWNTATWEEQATLRGHVDEVWAVAFSPDGKRLASGGKDGAVFIWPAEAPESPHLRLQLPRGFRSSDISPDGRVVAAVLADGSTAIWDVTTGQARASSVSFGTNNLCAFFTEAGHLLLGATNPAEAKIYDPRTDTLVHHPLNWASHPEWYWFDRARGTLFCSGRGDDNLLKLERWDLTSRQVLPPLQEAQRYGRKGGVFELAFAPIESRIALGGREDLTVCSLDGVGEEIIWHLGESGDDMVQGLSFIPGTQLLAEATLKEPVIRIRELPTGREVVSLRGHNSIVATISGSGDGRRLVTTSIGKEPLRLWDTTSWDEVMRLEEPGARFTAGRFIGDGNILVAEEVDGGFHLWRAPSWRDIANATAATKAPATL